MKSWQRVLLLLGAALLSCAALVVGFVLVDCAAAAALTPKLSLLDISALKIAQGETYAGLWPAGPLPGATPFVVIHVLLDASFMVSYAVLSVVLSGVVGLFSRVFRGVLLGVLGALLAIDVAEDSLFVVAGAHLLTTGIPPWVIDSLAVVTQLKLYSLDALGLGTLAGLVLTPIVLTLRRRRRTS